jgi:hypothetical protein
MHAAMVNAFEILRGEAGVSKVGAGDADHIGAELLEGRPLVRVELHFP